MAENTAVFHVLTVYRTVALHTAVYRLYPVYRATLIGIYKQDHNGAAKSRLVT
jgi:hypothetical protein